MKISLGGKFKASYINKHNTRIEFEAINTLFYRAQSALLEGVDPVVVLGSSNVATDRTDVLGGMVSPVSTTQLNVENAPTRVVITDDLEIIGTTKHSVSVGSDFIIAEIGIDGFSRAVLDTPRFIPAGTVLDIEYEFTLTLTTPEYTYEGTTDKPKLFVSQAILNRPWYKLLSDLNQYTFRNLTLSKPTYTVDRKTTVTRMTNSHPSQWLLGYSAAPVPYGANNSVLDATHEGFSIGNPDFVITIELPQQPIKSNQRLTAYLSLAIQ